MGKLRGGLWAASVQLLGRPLYEQRPGLGAVL